ncbi:unnamed protein product [Urochloa humidicola]
MLRAARALLSSRPAAGGGCTVSMSFLLRHNYKSLGHLLDAAVAAGKVRAIELEISTTSDLYSTNDVPQTTKAMKAHGRRATVQDGALRRLPGGVRGGADQARPQEHVHEQARRPRRHLAACPNLETLSLYASGVRTGPKQPWTIRHARLADVSITYCAFAGIDLAWLPNLERFAYKQWGSDADNKRKHHQLSFGHVPRLTTLVLSNTLLLGHRVVKLSQILADTAVTHLRLNFRGQNVWVEPEASKRFASIFRNLQHLRISNVHEECGLPWIMFLLQGAPNLKDLCIKLWDHECDFELDGRLPVKKKKNIVWEELPAGFKHCNLARLTILGFYNTGAGSLGIEKFLRSVVQAAPNLQEMHVREKAPCDECEVTEIAGPSSFPRTDVDKDAFRERICGGGSTPLKISIIHHQRS